MTTPAPDVGWLLLIMDSDHLDMTQVKEMSASQARTPNSNNKYQPQEFNQFPGRLWTTVTKTN
jgi:hypothetical protein